MASEILPPAAYSHSPAHFLLAAGDLRRLRRLLSSLPRLSHPSLILSESDSLLQSQLAAQISSILDRRDVPHRDSPLHLAVRLLPLSDAAAAVSALTLAGADPSLTNSSGWTPLQLSLSLRRRALAAVLLRHHRVSAWAQLRRRLPLLISSLSRIPNFRVRISVQFESALFPFVTKSAFPSDEIMVSKKGADFRIDRRRRLSLLFLARPGGCLELPFGSLVVVDREKKEVRDAFDEEIEGIVDDCSLGCRCGVEVGEACLVCCVNWRGRERVERVGEWRARVYELKNVVFRVRTLGVSVSGDEGLLELRVDEEGEEGFIVGEVRHRCCERGSLGVESREKEVVRSLKAMVWLAEDFPLRVEEILPVLDVVGEKVKVVRQVREVLTARFPPGTFPVKVYDLNFGEGFWGMVGLALLFCCGCCSCCGTGSAAGFL